MGQPAPRASLAQRLGLSMATLSEALTPLVAEGLVTASDHNFLLTDAGHQIAEAGIRRHRLAELMLTDILGIAWHRSHEQAEMLDEAITPLVEQAILANFTGEVTCPHGNPIPGAPSTISWSDLKPIGEMKVGEAARLARLLEDVHLLDHHVLLYLEETGLIPGRDVTLRKSRPMARFILKSTAAA